MKIERLNQLLQQDYPASAAWIPEKSGKRQAQVNVRFFPNSKVYTYSGTILSVAGRLGLIPEIDVSAEAEAAVAQLRNGQSAIVHIEAIDTIRYLAYPLLVGDMPAAEDEDEFGRKLVQVSVVEDDPWVVR